MSAEEDVASFRSAPMDRPTRTVTFATVLLFVVLLPPALLVGADDVDPAVGLVLGLAVSTLILAAWGFSPAGFDLEPGRVRMRRRLFGSRTFDLTGPVREAPPALGLGVRLGLTGGMFGWSGRMWNRQLGGYRAYLTDRSRIVSCETSSGIVLVSPDDPKAFVRAAKKRRKKGTP